jgi:hypothetical protein
VVESAQPFSAEDLDSPIRRLLPAFDFEAETDPGASPRPATYDPGSIASQEAYNKTAETKTTATGDYIQWTAEQGFFAVMGGFAVDINYNAESGQEIAVRRLVTTEGVAALARIGLLPIIRPEDVDERSNADVIAKVFVLSQVVWLYVPCMAPDLRALGREWLLAGTGSSPFA